MLFVTLEEHYSSSRTLSDTFARFGGMISLLCENARNMKHCYYLEVVRVTSIFRSKHQAHSCFPKQQWGHAARGWGHCEDL